jgi:hypothetical protein
MLCSSRHLKFASNSIELTEDSSKGPYQAPLKQSKGESNSRGLLPLRFVMIAYTSYWADIDCVLSACRMHVEYWIGLAGRPPIAGASSYRKSHNSERLFVIALAGINPQLSQNRIEFPWSESNMVWKATKPTAKQKWGNYNYGLDKHPRVRRYIQSGTAAGGVLLF